MNNTPDWISQLSSHLYHTIYVDSPQSSAAPALHGILAEATHSFLAAALQLVEAAHHSANGSRAEIPAGAQPSNVAARMLLPLLQTPSAPGAPVAPTTAAQADTPAWLMVDSRRRVLKANPSAQAYLEADSNSLVLLHEEISSSEPRSAAALQRLVTHAFSAANRQALHTEVLVPGTKDFASAVIVSVGHRTQDTEDSPSVGGVPLNIRNAFLDIAPNIEHRLRALLGFTKKEAELAASLLNGLSLQHAAEQRGVRSSTIRSQLSSLFRKTGTSQQGQLVALLARLAPPRERPRIDTRF